MQSLEVSGAVGHIYRSLGVKGIMPTFPNTLFRLHRWYKEEEQSLRPPMKMGQTECSETSTLKIQTPGNPSNERI